MVWADVALSKHPRFANNVRDNLSGVSLMLRAVTRLRKPDLHALFGLHVRARGAWVESPDRADAVFAADRGLTPFDPDRVAADYL
ncbi:hypothetical protein ETAA1_08470 [Urbifossiella limnaea]|uniref:Uncharacterized protein n=1 Tax=Urbifossiella limnaea TaxID=2528023 RepID=A0A517XN65_9BACT|nr:hypothetical protein ETAA1_08470 [Urbifossiella limnaea]